MSANPPILRIVCVEPNDRGGLQHFAFQVCEALAEAGHDVTLVTSTDSELAGAARQFRLRPTMRLWPVVDEQHAEADGPRRRLRLKVRRALRAGILVREWVRLCRSLVRERPDIVQFGVVRFPFEAVFLRYLRRRGLVLAQICHEFERRDQGPRWLAAATRRSSGPVYASFDAIFVLSDDVRRRLIHEHDLDPTRVHRIPHGDESVLFRDPVDRASERRRYELAPDDRIALCFGRIRPTKGVEDLFDAWPRVIAGVPSAKLLVVGSPAGAVDVPRLRSRVAGDDFAGSVTLDPRYVPIDEVPSLFAIADVVVLPYRDATQSGVLHVAYTAGRPVVATSVGGLAEDIEDGVTGRLVPAGDIDALGRALEQLLTDRELADAMGRRGRERSLQRHSWTAVAGRLLATYEDLVGARSDRSEDAAPGSRSAMPDDSKLRVRTGRDYLVSFTVDLGQRNAEVVKGPQTPLKRVAVWADAFAFFPGPRWDVIHTVNAVPLLRRTRFVVSFEDYLPRCPEDRKGGQWLNGLLRERLLSPRCIRILAMSEFAVRMFERQQAGWRGLDRALAKTEVLYPALDVRAARPKRANDTLKLCFVGKDYLRKGGPALVRAHERLRRAGIPVETTVVSSLRWDEGEYIGPPSASVHAEEMRRLAAAEGIVHRGSLPNSETLRVMDESDYLVFPTLHDTFGFVSLEAMAGGTPVIVSGTCAQAEVVEHGESGFVLPFDNDETGRWRYLYRNADPGYVDAYQATIESLATSIEERLTCCWENRAGYEALSAGAIERVRTRFDRTRARDRLEAIYDERPGS